MVGDGGSRLIETREPISTLDFFFIIAVVARRRRCQGVVCLVDHSAWCLRASSITCGHWNGIFQSAQRGNHPARGLGLVLDRAQSGGGSLTLDSFSPPPFLTHTTFQQQKKTYKLQVHTGLAKNARQAYAVSYPAGMQTAAESWGTGRAVSRIPRVPGGGTHRAGQGAFGNMCRGGRMFAPTKTWRRWHRKVNVNLKRYAVASALAASALPSLVMARGHRVDAVPELPLVVDDSAESLTKTAKAVQLLEALGAGAELARARDARNIRRGKGKLRNRRYVGRRGPLVVYAGDGAVSRAFRGIPGVDTASVDRLNLLQLAPGGHVGRLIVWTKGAFERLEALYGAGAGAEAAEKKGYTLPRPIMANADVARLINSDEVQSVVRPPRSGSRKAGLRKNPLKNLGAMLKLNPAAGAAKRAALRASAKGKGAPKKGRPADARAASKAFLAKMQADHDYLGDDYDVFSSWLGTSE